MAVSDCNWAVILLFCSNISPLVNSSFIDYYYLLIKIYKHSEVRQFCQGLLALHCSYELWFYVRLLTLV